MQLESTTAAADLNVYFDENTYGHAQTIAELTLARLEKGGDATA